MQEIYDKIVRVAPTEATVLLTGESGTGKEIAARTIHELSYRRKKSFLAINCGAISASLIENEMFGHERGSYTGADRQHKGYFEQADGGTLFLDEISEMPLELQVRLLRVLETGTFMRVGTSRPIEADVRIIAATNRDPREAVRAGRLREDLYHRLNVFPLVMAPLRERGEDIELIANHFLAEMNEACGTRKKFAPGAIELMRDFPWPGNVRELKNYIHRVFIMAGQRRPAGARADGRSAGAKGSCTRFPRHPTSGRRLRPSPCRWALRCPSRRAASSSRRCNTVAESASAPRKSWASAPRLSTTAFGSTACARNPRTRWGSRIRWATRPRAFMKPGPGRSHSALARLRHARPAHAAQLHQDVGRSAPVTTGRPR
jgi:DNA-binding NtrC family response regulator